MEATARAADSAIEADGFTDLECFKSDAIAPCGALPGELDTGPDGIVARKEPAAPDPGQTVSQFRNGE
jgi:hypothetical protein